LVCRSSASASAQPSLPDTSALSQLFLIGALSHPLTISDYIPAYRRHPEGAGATCENEDHNLSTRASVTICLIVVNTRMHAECVSFGLGSSFIASILENAVL